MQHELKQMQQILGSFAELRKASVIFVFVGLSYCVCPPSWNNATPTGRTSMEFHTRGFFFPKIGENIPFLLKSVKNEGCLT